MITQQSRLGGRMTVVSSRGTLTIRVAYSRNGAYEFKRNRQPIRKQIESCVREVVATERQDGKNYARKYANLDYGGMAEFNRGTRHLRPENPGYGPWADNPIDLAITEKPNVGEYSVGIYYTPTD